MWTICVILSTCQFLSLPSHYVHLPYIGQTRSYGPLYIQSRGSLLLILLFFLFLSDSLSLVPLHPLIIILLVLLPPSSSFSSSSSPCSSSTLPPCPHHALYRPLPLPPLCYTPRAEPLKWATFTPPLLWWALLCMLSFFLVADNDLPPLSIIGPNKHSTSAWKKRKRKGEKTHTR